MTLTDSWTVLSNVTAGGQPSPAPGPAVVPTWATTGTTDFTDPNAFAMIAANLVSSWRILSGQTAAYDVGLLGTVQGFDNGSGIMVTALKEISMVPVTPLISADTIVVQGIICVHEETLVKTPSGAKRIAEIQAGERCYDARGQVQRVERNLCSGATKKYVQIRRGALGKQLPSRDLLIARGHPLLLNGKEVPCEELIDGHMIQEIELEQPARLFTLCTEGRNFVDMQGLLVGTWSNDSLENFKQNDGFGSHLRLTEQ